MYVVVQAEPHKENDHFQVHIPSLCTSHSAAGPRLLKMMLFYSVIWKPEGIVVIQLTDVQLLSEIC